MHPNTAALLAFFKYEHLPPKLQLVSKPFALLAQEMAADLDGPELTVGLRKLLEAKDCCVRAALTPPPVVRAADRAPAVLSDAALVARAEGRTE